MAVQFDVDTGKARIELSRLMQMVSKIGSTLEAAEATSESALSSMEQSLSTATFAASEAVNKFKALSSGVGDLNQVLRTADVLNRYSKMILDLNAAMDQSTINATKLANATKLTNEGYRTSELVAKERLKTAEAGATAEVRSEEAFRRSAIALEQLATITGRLAAIENERVAGARAVAVEGQKQANATALLVEKTEQLNTAQGQKLATDKAQYDSAVRMATAQARQAAAIAETTQAIELLNSPEGRRLAQLKATQSALTQAATFNERMAATTAKLRAETEFLATAEGREQLQLRATNRIARQAADEKINHAAEAAKLRRELEFLRTEEGKRLLLLRQEAAEERRAAVAVAESTVARSRGINIGNQLTSGMRAAIQGLRSSIGIYTSSTILFASAVFGLSRAFRSGLDAGMAYTEAMARTRAVIGGAESDFKLLESQVIRLGASTPFLTNEVAKAATELGLIGLSAKQAAQALEPVLNFSILGDVGIAEAAKQMTDVMLIFNKQTSDLTDITNVMAVAAARSSATVDQITLSLSYAGPAAHAMGVSMRDVTAAVETLSNAGIRGERAGTALRRMFVNLANPTTKGAKALAELNVHVLDIDGNAKSLTDILGQLNNGLNKLGGAEKLSKLADIFGVRAASSMAALLSNMTNFVKLRAQLDNTDNAAKEMVSTLRDALTFDYRDLKAAFESLQVKVFADNSYQLRLWTEQIRGFFTFLAERSDGGATNLERYASILMTIGKITAAAFATKYLFGFTAALTKFEASSAGAAFQYRMLAQQAGTAGLAIQGASLKLTQQNIILRATNVLLGESAMRSLAASRAFVFMATGVRFLTGVMAGLSAAAGWLAIIGTVGYAIYQLYKRATGKDVSQNADQLQSKAAELKKQYEDLKKSVDNATLAQQAEAIKSNLGTDRSEMEEASKRLWVLIAQRHDLAGANDELSRAYDVLITREREHIEDLTRSISDGTKALKEIQDSLSNTMSPFEKLRAAQKELQSMPFFMTDEQKARSKELMLIIMNLQREMDKLSAAQKTKAPDPMAFGLFNDKMNTFLTDGYSEVLDKAGLSQKDLNAEMLKAGENSAKMNEQLAAARTVLASVTDANGKYTVSGDKVVELQKNVEQASVAAKNALVEYLQAIGLAAKGNEEFAKAWEGYQFSLLSPDKQKAANQAELDSINKRLEAIGKLTQAQRDALSTQDQKLIEADISRRDALMSSLKPTRSEVSKDNSTEKFLSNLRAQLNPIAEAANKARESIEKLASIKGLSGNERGLLSGQIEFDSLKSRLEFSPDSLQEQIDSIDAWKQKELALADAIKNTTVREQVRAQILRQSQSLTNQRIDQMESEKFELIDYNNALRDQDAVLQQQMDDRVAAIGVGQQAGQQQQALTKLNRDYVNNSIKLQREHTRALDTLRAKGDQAEIDKENRKYAQKEQDLKDSYARQVVITENGYRDLIAAQGNVKLGIQGGLSQVIEDGTNMAGKMQQAVVGGFNDMTDAVVNFAKTGKFSLKDFALNFAEMMMRMELAALEAKLAMTILGLLAPSGNYAVDTGGASGINFGGMYGSGSGTFNGIAGANGLAFDKGTVTAMAKGGLINRPTLFPMATGGVALGGEAGTEAIMPLKRMGSGDLGVRVEGAGGGGDTFNFQTNVNVNSDGSSTTSSTADDSKAGRQLAKMIEAKTKEIIVRATQPGGILWKQRNGVTA